MVSSSVAVRGRKMSTVVPATVTGENVVYVLSNMDLAMKLHYVRGVYYFRGVAGLETIVLKEALYRLLDKYFPVSGRIRRSDTGRPFIKCNDSGVRIVEASCDVTLEEWLQMEEISHRKQLFPDHFLGPNLHFSPLVLVQFTWFNGGGFALGLSWSHLLGDAASAANFINQFGQALRGNHSSLHTQKLQSFSVQIKDKTTRSSMHHLKPPLSIKHVDPIDNHWVAASNSKMESFSFHITETKIRHLQSKFCGDNSIQFQPFEVLCAVVWQCIAKIRDNKEPRTITICRPNSNSSAKTTATGIMSNIQTITTVVIANPDVSPSEIELVELARLIASGTEKDENLEIEEEVDESSGSPDLILYGANLTFVDMEEIELYGLEVKGQKPVLVDYMIDGVGDEGAVLVLQGGGGEGGSRGGGRMLNAIFPEEQLLRLRQELARGWGIA